MTTQEYGGSVISEIDVKKIVIPYNWVLIKLDPDHEVYHNTETGGNTGLFVAPWGINAASHIATTGVVEVVPNALIFNGYEMAVLKQKLERSEQEQNVIADLRKESMSYDVPIEIKKGMRVYFEYTTRLDAIKEGRIMDTADGRFMLVAYDDLIMMFHPDTNPNDIKISDVHMLNGMVLVKPLEYQTEKTADGIRGVRTEFDLFMPVQESAKFIKRGNCWYGVVLSAGCGVKAYADFPGRGGEFEAKTNPCSKPGNKIVYDGRMQKRLEVKHHRVIFKGHEFYRIHRKDILGYFADGNINGMPKV